VRLEVASICGNDLRAVAGRVEEPVPLVLGREGVGTIEAMGPEGITGRSGDTILREGDRVTFTTSASCGLCPECVSHKLPQKCVSVMKYGQTSMTNGCGLNGTFATHILLRPGTHVVRIPEALDSRLCAPSNDDLATVCNVLDTARLPRYGSNSSAVVQGANLMGIYAVAWLRHRVGMESVFCFDTNLERLRVAEQFGAIPLLVREGEDERMERARIVRERRPRGVDVVMEASGANDAIVEGVQLLRNGGHYAFAGMADSRDDSRLSLLTGETIIRKCLTIRGAYRYAPWNLEQAVSFLAEFRESLPLESLVSPTSRDLGGLQQSFDEAAGGSHCRVLSACQAP